MLSIFDHELVQTAVVSIGRGPARSGFYDRTLHFRRVDESATLVPLRPRPAGLRATRPRFGRSERGARARGSRHRSPAVIHLVTAGGS